MKTIGSIIMPDYFTYLLISFIGTLVLTPIAIFVCYRYNLLGRELGGRHIHTKRIPRLGGLVIFVIFWLVMMGISAWSGHVVFDKNLIGVLAASCLLLFIGVLDDIKEISWKWQLLGQITSIGIVIASGIGIPHLTNPFGGLIPLSQTHFTIITLNNIAYNLTLPADIFVFIWIILIINTINWLDGLDGLASGVSVIGSFTLFFLSITPIVNQPQTAILAIVLAGAALGFLIYNFSPAKIFLGSGSVFLGFMLAVLSIISGGKIATALLVLGFPVLDALWVILQRWRAKTSIFRADKRHFHHKLLELGLSQHTIVLLIYFITALFGVIAVVGQSKSKIIALVILVFLMVIIGFVVNRTLRGQVRIRGRRVL